MFLKRLIYKMKFFNILILFYFSICSITDTIDIENISSESEAYDKVKKLFIKYQKMDSGQEKEEFSEYIRNLILKLAQKFITNEELIKKFEEILDKLETSDYVGAGSYSISFFSKQISLEEIKNTIKDRASELVTYCEGDKCTIPKDVLTKSNEALKSSASITTKWVYVSNGVAIVGYGLAAYLRFNEKYNKCKIKGKESIFISTIITAANIGTNIAFGAIGSIAGSFIPIPIVNTFVGGFIGSLFGSYVNKKYDLDC